MLVRAEVRQNRRYVPSIARAALAPSTAELVMRSHQISDKLRGPNGSRSSAQKQKKTGYTSRFVRVLLAQGPC